MKIMQNPDQNFEEIFLETNKKHKITLMCQKSKMKINYIHYNN